MTTAREMRIHFEYAEECLESGNHAPLLNTIDAIIRWIESYEERKNVSPRRDVCGVRGPERYLCTCDEGHTGDHIATGLNSQIYETWG